MIATVRLEVSEGPAMAFATNMPGIPSQKKRTIQIGGFGKWNFVINKP
jgi:hypothetical protein